MWKKQASLTGNEKKMKRLSWLVQNTCFFVGQYYKGSKNQKSQIHSTGEDSDISYDKKSDGTKNGYGTT